MVKVIEMDEKATINVQLEEDTGAVILINMFTVTHEDADQFLETWGFSRRNLRNYLDSLGGRQHSKHHNEYRSTFAQLARALDYGANSCLKIVYQ